MIATPPPRKDRGSNPSRSGFRLVLAALCVTGLVLVVWLVFEDSLIGKADERARSAKDQRGETGVPVFQEDLPEAEPEPVAEPFTVVEKTSESKPATTDAMFSNIAKAQKTSVPANSRDALALRSFSIRSIEPTFVKSPIYLLANGKEKSFIPKTWLRVVVSFSSPSVRIAELSFRYKISLGDEIFTGTMTHGEILGEGEHQVAVYVIPAVVESLLKRRDFVANENVKIEVEVVNGETVLARSEFGQVLIAPGKVRPDLLRSVEKTPFAPLEIDFYERAVD